MDRVLTGAPAPRRLSMILLEVFAGLALVLPCVEIYGVVSYLVGHRARLDKMLREVELAL
jgi:hypothetical protein